MENSFKAALANDRDIPRALVLPLPLFVTEVQLHSRPQAPLPENIMNIHPRNYSLPTPPREVGPGQLDQYKPGGQLEGTAKGGQLPNTYLYGKMGANLTPT
jgi:hypothetical protein